MNSAPNPSKRRNFMQLLIGLGFGILGWVLCLGTLLLSVVLEEERNVHVGNAVNGLAIVLIWLPWLAYLIWRLAKHRTQGLAYPIIGGLVGLALPLLVVIAFLLVYGVPHA